MYLKKVEAKNQLQSLVSYVILSSYSLKNIDTC